jgi:hypothetical protein
MGAESRAFLADTILILHFAFVLFVVGGLLVTWIGYFAGWRFVRNPWFRIAHLLAMAIVVAESLFGIICPLTNWETSLRAKAGEDPAYQGSFIQHWVHRLMFFEISEKTFTLIYVAVFAFIALSFVVVPPRGFRASPGDARS